MNKQALQVHYMTFDNEDYTFQIHPYLLRQFRQRWYLYGWSAAENKLYNLALDRIKHLHGLEKVEFKEYTIADWSQYFEPLVGVTRRENTVPLDVLIRVKKAPGILSDNQAVA